MDHPQPAQPGPAQHSAGSALAGHSLQHSPYPAHQVPPSHAAAVSAPSAKLGLGGTPVPSANHPGGVLARNDSPAPNEGSPAKKQKVKADADEPKSRGSGGRKADKERKTRSRLACLACKSTKQKCDGPSRIPCRRCELYNLECKFPPSSNVIIPEAAATPTAAEAPAVVATKLQEISARLKSIEAALRLGTASAAYNDDASSQGVSGPARSMLSDDDHSDDDDEADEDDEHGKDNAILALNQSVDQVVGPVTPKRTATVEDYGAPDVIRRGILSPSDVQELFEFYFCSVHSWTMMLDITDDRDAMAVRERSPLLFHTILLVASAYSSPFPSQLHTTLTTFLNAIIAPQILSPQPHELNGDFLRAMDLLLIYKPTQWAARRAEGKSDTDAVRLSKINDLASWMIQGIMARTVDRIDLPSVLGRFSRAYSSSSAGSAMPIPKKVIHDLRLYYWVLSNDVHGNVQNGRKCNLEGHTALATTRLFHSLQLQPGDTRLAASVEMFEIARPIMRSFSYERTKKIARSDLERFTSGTAAWEEHWVPILQRQLPVDPLAMTVLCPFLWFITLTFNASALVTWKMNRHYASDSSGEDSTRTVRKLRIEGARGLTEWEAECLNRSVRAAEALIFTLSEESRVPGAWRAVQWGEAERSDGWRKLVLDDTIVDHSRWAMDALFINMSFALIFLCKLVNEGVLTPNLVLVRNPEMQQPWVYTQKLPRLLELGSQFLDAIALNAHHPAKQQAQVLRALLDAGVRGTAVSPPGPRNAATVMSPMPNSSPRQFTQPRMAAQQGPGGIMGQPSAQQIWQAQDQMPVGSSQSQMYHHPQHQQPQQAQPQQQHPPHLAPGGMPGQAPGELPRPTALDDVLSGFDFGDAPSFWEWGGSGGGGGGGLTSVDWNSLAGVANNMNNMRA